ncbi:hypothetical protein [Streptomyces sp. NPDC096132]|uniref:hypothetical protein n=1 Tax=Streptomyces sp. NPDC096132 TaxID=3366075 RepID=UPI00382AC5BF
MVLGSDLRRGNARRGNGSRAVGRGTAVAAAFVLVFAPTLAACSDDDGGNGASSPSASATPAPTSAAASAPADAAAAEQQVRRNWQKFFDPATSTEDKVAVLENGRMMGPVLQAFGGDQRGGQVAAEVEKVEFTSPTEATVTYTLTLDGATALPNASGKAVLQDGTWKVSVTTLCALVELSGDASASAVPGC